MGRFQPAILSKGFVWVGAGGEGEIGTIQRENRRWMRHGVDEEHEEEEEGEG